jgi:hypothetical protein
VGGVGDHHVEAAESIERGGDDTTSARGVSRVGHERAGPGSQRLGGRLQRAGATAGDDDAIAELGAMSRDRQADPA